MSELPVRPEQDEAEIRRPRLAADIGGVALPDQPDIAAPRQRIRTRRWLQEASAAPTEEQLDPAEQLYTLAEQQLTPEMAGSIRAIFDESERGDGQPARRFFGGLLATYVPDVIDETSVIDRQQYLVLARATGYKMPQGTKPTPLRFLDGPLTQKFGQGHLPARQLLAEGMTQLLAHHQRFAEQPPTEPETPEQPAQLPAEKPEVKKELTDFQRDLRRLLLGTQLSEKQLSFLEQHLLGEPLPQQAAITMRSVFGAAQRALGLVQQKTTLELRKHSYNAVDPKKVLKPEEFRLLSLLVGNANGQEPIDMQHVLARQKGTVSEEQYKTAVQAIIAKAARIAH